MGSFRGFPPIKSNFTAIPNLFFDELLSEIKSVAELKVLLYIFRHTYGWQKRFDCISLSQFVSGVITREGVKVDNGIGIDKKSVLRGIDGCLERGTILKWSDGFRGREQVWYFINTEENRKYLLQLETGATTIEEIIYRNRGNRYIETDDSDNEDELEGGNIPPGSGELPPGGGKMPPGSGKMPPGSGKMPPGSGKMPPGSGKMPPGGGKMPLGSGKMPPGGGELPPGSGELPPEGSGKMPLGSGELPLGGGKLPPEGSGKMPLGSGELPLEGWQNATGGGGKMPLGGWQNATGGGGKMPPTKESSTKESSTKENIKKTTSKEDDDVLLKLKSYGFKDNLVEELVERYGPDHIENEIDRLEGREDIKNKGAYLNDALRNGYSAVREDNGGYAIYQGQRHKVLYTFSHRVILWDEERKTNFPVDREDVEIE